MITLGKCSSHPSFKNPLLQKLETIAESQTSLKQEEQLTMVFPATVDISTMQPTPYSQEEEHCRRKAGQTVTARGPGRLT